MRVLVLVIVCLLLQSCASAVKGRELQTAKRDFADGNYRTAYHELLPLATEGDATAQYALGYLYYNGYGVTQDTETGRFWMTKSADQHYAPAEKALKLLR
jgi:TPR repeat protein